MVDPSDVLLEAVARPIRAYLRARKDTVRCIVTSLTDENSGTYYHSLSQATNPWIEPCVMMKVALDNPYLPGPPFARWFSYLAHLPLPCDAGDLHEELRRQEAGALEQGVDSDDEEGGPGEDWQPPSHDAYARCASLPSVYSPRFMMGLPPFGLRPHFHEGSRVLDNQYTASKWAYGYQRILEGSSLCVSLSCSLLSSRRRGDILSLLVSIYGSKELFVSEYRLMLADRLLTRRTHDTDREVQNLELLKLRFGEASLHHCEIMIRCVSLLPSTHRCKSRYPSSVPPQPLSYTCCCRCVCDAGMWTTRSA